MDERTEPSSPQPESGQKIQVPFSGVFGEISSFPTGHTQKARARFLGIFGEMPEFREPLKFSEWFGAQLANRILWFICGLATTFLIAWWFTRPSLTDVQQLLGPSAQGKDLVEVLRSLRRDHFDQFRDLFQLVVLSVLVPLFTLLAGYTFGKREGEKQG